MAKVSKTVNHDWLAVRATFPGGVKANVTWSRNGETVTVDPPDAKRADTLSLIVMENLAHIRARTEGYPHKDLGATVDVMERVAREATTLDQYLEGLKSALRVTGERPKPKGDAPAETKAELVSKRGYQLDAHFPSGERMCLKINKSSVGLSLAPNVASKFNEITRLVFAAKQAGITDDESIAQAALEAARSSGDLDEWVGTLRAELFPGAAPRR